MLFLSRDEMQAESKQDAQGDDLNRSAAQFEPVELAITWAGVERCFEAVLVGVGEILVQDCDLEAFDLQHREAAIHCCDGGVLDEVACRVAFSGFGARGEARFRVLAQGEARELERLLRDLRVRQELRRQLSRAQLEVACGWI